MKRKIPEFFAVVGCTILAGFATLAFVQVCFDEKHATFMQTDLVIAYGMAACGVAALAILWVLVVDLWVTWVRL